mmetsp:Transcript_71003/g.112852  ORF Transcript_71003/g.112852 Transcript_71003/m.112852 type:complete len:201 (-) Transcript_71003:211-813(-)|eukprot:CAMPEP_0197030188 /NCGR_PEP_ID=MMETSP1384-20130603/9473_1 /TAXON_ID=29189 /ORGANISM="Ammonia sp." /LENGTH=200 /DNA_ID=CAMNT_0042459483 /DNA_START=25 /DNA_END=627 /DNA_ORIENTATION=-
MSTYGSNVPEYKIVVLGGGGVGKSALTIRLVTDDFLEEYDPTIEDSYRKQINIDDRPALLDILDTAGQEEFSSMQDNWIREGKGFLLVYSITSPHTFNMIGTLRDKIFRTKDVDDETQKDIPMVIAGNKCDLEYERKVSFEDGQKLAQSFGCPFFETSAKTKINNADCFYQIVRMIRLRPDMQEKETKSEKKKGGFCEIL